MTPTAPFEREDRRPLDVTSASGGSVLSDRRLRQATWAFVGLGVLLRLARYLMDYPLWWDEAFVAVNFLRRGYRDLVRPLDYGQVCPILFLWVELTVVKLLGFSEWTLRLFPLACGVASVFLFRQLAGLLLRGVPLLAAVAIFAVSFHPVRHAADLKPYASDLLAALILLVLASGWWRAPERTGRLWALAAVAPVLLALSHPAVFVAVGIGAGLALSVVRTPRLGVRAAYAAFLLSTAGSFLAIYAAFTRTQASATLSAMQVQWDKAFPPLADSLALAAWMVRVHTGGMFAYPCGSDGGGSVVTLLLFLTGAVVLWRRGRGTFLAVCLAQFGAALVAAALRQYPYGGGTHGSPSRVMQYLAPGICLLAGLGAASLLVRFVPARFRFRALRCVLLALVAVGVVPLAADIPRPYRAIQARRAREFARRFWPGLTRDAEPVCLLWDLGIGRWNSINLNVAVYLCNQKIYSPRRNRGEGPRWEAVTESHPLRCVLPLSDPDEGPVVNWLDSMKAGYRLSGRRTIVVDTAAPGAKPRTETYVVYEFLPKDGRHLVGDASARVVRAPALAR
jgi:hypothetical protein